MLKSTIKTYSRVMACVLSLVAVLCCAFGNGAFDAQTVAAASSQVVPTQVQAEEKPYVNIVTNVVVNASGKPTGYVELALLVKTPKVGDGDAAVQTTFRNLAVTLEYNDELLVPVSWDHEIRYSDDGTSIINNYPDFVDSYNDIDLETATEADVIARAAEVNSLFESTAQYSIPLNALQHETALEGDIAFVGGPKPLLSLSASSTTDLVLLEETPLVVVRFLYTGTDLNAVVQSDTTVNPDMITSGHDEQGNSVGAQLKSLFWFADDADIDSSPTNQALYYTSGDHVGLNYGENNFYATKVMYNGSEVTLPSYIDKSGANYTESSTYKDAAGDWLDRPLTGDGDETSDDFDLDRKVVKAVSTEDGATEETNGYYSYTSNLLFTSDSKESKTAVELYDEHTNIRFGVVAQESFRSTGGVDLSQVTTVVFLDWDDTILGALAVVKGDARASINAYVENFIHPSLRFSNPDNANNLEALATSLERQYTYAGKYNNTDDNGDGVFDSGAVTDGDSYPLTNKLDYAFIRRPVISCNTYQPPATDDDDWPYRNAAGEMVEATEWKTGTVDWANGDYPYIYGWAVVEDPSKSDSVWTTFGGYGELQEIKLPGYDADNDNDGVDQFRNNTIRAAGDSSGTDPCDGAYSAIDSSEISFASYADSAYFRFADFSDLADSPEAIFVKACYEPSEEISWTDYYVVIDSPYYEKAGLPGSTVKGSAYTISFNYERIHSKDNPKGVLRLRLPAARIQFISDDVGQYGDESYLNGYVTNTDVLEMEFSPSGLHIAAEYTLVETYGGNYIAAIDRSKQGNEAQILNNFLYKASPDLSDNYEDGFSYENRLGSSGFVYWGTLRQVLKECSEIITSGNDAELSTFASSYLSRDTLADLNLRVDESGTLPQSASQTQYYDTTDAIVEAITIAIEKNYVDDTGVAQLDWHQLQYHILNWENGGILQNGTILEPGECGNYSWCRLDDCSDGVSVSTLTEALVAVHTARIDNTASSAKKQAAEAALAANLSGDSGVLARAKVIKDDAGKTLATEALATGAFISTDVPNLINAIEELIKKASDDGVDYLSLNEAQVQRWLTSYLRNPQTASYEDPGISDEPILSNPRFEFWWHYYDVKPQAIDFEGVTAETAVEKLIAAAVSAHEGNVLAWAAIEIEHIEDMRFSKSDRGDFFYSDSDNDDVADAYAAIASEYDDYRVSIRDTREEDSLMLTGYTESELQNFITAVSMLVEAIADGDGDGTWISSSSISLVWEQVQYYLLYGTLPSNPGYYEEVYWWKDDDDGFRLDILAVPDARGYIYEGVTINDLRSKLFLYAGAAENNRESLANEFRAWFTPEVATDLILRYENGWVISDDYKTIVANRLLEYALQHAQRDVAFSEFTWDQVQYAIINAGTYATLKSAQANLTYDTTKCQWGTKGTADGSASSESNRWREDYRESINDLKILIEAIDSYVESDPGAALRAVESFDELSSENLFFRTSNDWLHDDFENLSGNDVTEALARLKALCGGEWSTIVSSVASYNYNTYRSDMVVIDAWYLIQYYLENGSVIAASGSGTMFDLTVDAGLSEYYWEYGWNGISDTAGFKKTIESGVPARIAYIKATYTEGPSSYIDNIHGAAYTPTTWDVVITEATNLVAKHTADGTQLLTDPWWRQLQFLVVHTLQDGAENMLSVATNEANNYYWWHKNGSEKVLTLADTPTDTDAARATASASIMEAALLKYAAGNTKNDAFFTGAAGAEIVGTLATYLNIRNADADDVAAATDTSRNSIPCYSTAQIAEALPALVAAVYEGSVTGAVSGWDYVTNFANNAITNSGALCVYTYNAAAYNALKSLTAHQIQHWFFTYFNNGAANASYDATAAEGAGYWWIKDATKQAEDAVSFETFQEFTTYMVAYAVKKQLLGGSADSFNALIDSEWSKYFTSDPSTAKAKISTIANMYDDGSCSWAQFAILTLYDTSLSVSDAAMYAPLLGISIPAGFEGTCTLDVNEIVAIAMS